MKYYHIVAKLLSPLMVQRGRQTNAPETLSYLPGSTLRGAVAAKFFQQGGSQNDASFLSLFVEHPISFPNLLPASDPGTLPSMLPLTAVSCKRHPGFLTEERHGVRDHLAVTAARRLLKQTLKGNSARCFHNGPAKTCREFLEPFTAYWNGSLDKPLEQKTNVLYRRHTGIDRMTGTVASAVFYTTQAIADYCRDETSEEKGGNGSGDPDFRRQYLSGAFYMDDDQFELLRPLIEQGSLFVGADRSRGYGEIEVSIREREPPGFNVSEWSKEFHARVVMVSGEELEDAIYFSLKLESHAVLVDRYLRPASDITIAFPEIEPLLKVTRGHILRGWQTAWGLPKPDDMALSMGSVFLFRYTGKDIQGLESALQGMAREGIGLRREEGCGRVSLCDPFHLTEVI